MSTATSIIAKIFQLHNQGQTPAQITAELFPGAENDTYVERVISRIDNPPKLKRATRRQTSARRKSTFRADTVLSSFETQATRTGQAQAELVSRVNAGRYICSWCGKDMGPAPTEQDSHGICDECAADVLKEYEAGGDGPAPDPQGGYQVVINGEPCMWFDAPEEASRAYHAYYEPTPVFWTFAGQTVELEAI